MKRLRDSDNYDLRQQKRLKGVSFPHTIQSLPHVLRRIDMFALSLEEASTEAAASGQLDWLKRILPRVTEDQDDVACSVIDTAAAKNQCEIIKFTYRWWTKEVSEPRKFCENALLKAVEGGHLEAARCLLAHWYEYRDVPESHEDAEVGVTRYFFDVVEALELAVKKEHHKIVEAICERSLKTEDLYRWGADNGRLDVVEHVYDNSPNDFDSLYEVLLTVIRGGYLDIVQFIFEKRGGELLDYVEGDDLFDTPLVVAAKQGTEEVLEYVYSWFVEHNFDGFEYGPAFCTAAGAGRLAWVKTLYEQHRIGFLGLDTAFADAAGGNHLDVVRFLQSQQDFDISFIDRAFIAAAGYGQIEAVKYLCGIDGYETSASALHRAFVNAAGGGHLNVLKFLDARGRVSLQTVTKAFASAACNRGLLEKTRGGQVEVLAYLYAKECITSKHISDAFTVAASHSCVDVVEFLYAKCSISSALVNKAFRTAGQDNCIEVAEFLFKTGAVRTETVEKEFLDAATGADLYALEFFFNSCGCNSTALLERASNLDCSERVQRFLRQKQSSLAK